jgi:sporulation protein YabP
MQEVLFMEEKNNAVKSHKVLLANRSSGTFSGVVDVLSFDVAEILLETELGMLLVKGHDLHVNRLSLEKGEIDMEGRIDSLTYSDVKTAGKQAQSLFGRLFG